MKYVILNEPIVLLEGNLIFPKDVKLFFFLYNGHFFVQHPDNETFFIQVNQSIIKEWNLN